ncbi:MAG: hypothetical protein CVU84_15610 [Firmicutes bacterium HGW-Firmicutes-1]|jgi:CheY-like chemotaxis protein|nr:MAG: hypothetical protein CVU84_15610 [Firmicutes bacterium HGW-Firmicutes-1]
MARILIVDDSIVMRKNLAAILTQGGHTIIGEASNGRQAISQYTELKPDIVTMDISMPIMSGVEAVKQIVKFCNDAKIIMISAVNQKKMVFSAINNGASHYIVKPIDPKKLLSIVDELLSSPDDEVIPRNLEAQNTQQGFDIENIEGVFIITFNQFLGLKDHNLLGMAIRGLMFINPLKVQFNFNEIDQLSDEILEPILRLSVEIKDANGTVSYSAKSTEMQQKLIKWEK